MIVAPLPTPFDGDHPDWPAFAELIAALEPYLDGLLLFGSNGEAVHLNPLEQRMGLLGVVPEVSPSGWVPALRVFRKLQCCSSRLRRLVQWPRWSRRHATLPAQ